jgi:2-polyprenyl-6-methoxyphenol hydroxylase-like FAD-dependent oxidoreductase
MSLSILISGVGVAGPTSAYWLNHHGFAVTLVERAPALRSGGYVIDFWGLGYDIAELMGLLPEIESVGYHMQELRIVDEIGQRVAGFGTRVFSELTGGRYVTLARSDLSRLIFEKLKDSNEIIFGDEITEIYQDSQGVSVTFAHGEERRFDLVIGAGGLHSKTRKLVFGPQGQFERYLGYTVAAFEVSGYRPRDECVYVMYNKPGRMVGRIALHEDRTLFLFVFVSDYDVAPDQSDIIAQKVIVRETFRDGGWECGAILSELDRTDDLYFDRVSQIQMEGWSKGRIALIGDAAFCVSLLAGQGAALAMLSAYVLAGELSKVRGDYTQAFAQYENLLRPFILKKQAAAKAFASSFAPRTSFGVFVRNQVVTALRIPGLARLTIGRDISDTMKLPNYSSN